jgi:hypothetical protein
MTTASPVAPSTARKPRVIRTNKFTAGGRRGCGPLRHGLNHSYSSKWNVYALPVEPDAVEFVSPGARNA